MIQKSAAVHARGAWNGTEPRGLCAGARAEFPLCCGGPLFLAVAEAERFTGGVPTLEGLVSRYPRTLVALISGSAQLCLQFLHRLAQLIELRGAFPWAVSISSQILRAHRRAVGMHSGYPPVRAHETILAQWSLWAL